MQGTGHTLFERRLRGDINAKNALSGEYESRIRLVRRFRGAAGKAHGRRKQKKYAMTAERLLREAESFRVEVLKRIQDLELRIRQEMRFSEQEVAAFQSQFEKEHREWVAAQEKRQTAAQALRMLIRDSGLARRSMTAEEAASLDKVQRE